MLRRFFEQLIETVWPEDGRGLVCTSARCGRRAVGQLVVLLADGGRRLVPRCRVHLAAATV